MDTDCFHSNIDIDAINTLDLALTKHPQDARGGFARVAEQCVRSCARDKFAIGQIISIGENFVRNLQTLLDSGPGEIGLLRSEQDQR